MIACLTIPGFSLRAPLLSRPELKGKPVALAPVPGTRPLIGSCTRAAEQAGVRPGMRLSEALATCPQLELVEQDPAGVEEAWESVLRRLEEAGFAVEPVEPGCVYFETRGVERLAGGLEQALRRALDAVGEEWRARVGAASRRFAALAAATVAPAGRALVIDDGETHLFLEPFPLDLLPLSPERREELSELGVKRLGELARLPGAAVADRLGADGAEAWQLARGEGNGDASVEPRRPPAEIAETLSFPEPVANELTLARAVGGARRAPARPPGAGRPGPSAARPLGEARRRRLLAALADAARADGGARPPSARVGVQAGGAAGAHGGAAARAGGADGVGRDTGRARSPARQPTAGAPARRAPAGSRRGGIGRGLHRRGGRAVVAHPGDSGHSRSARRLNEPRPALVACEDGVPDGDRPGACGRAARGVAGRRPLVDGGAGGTALLRGAARERAERRGLPGRGERRVVPADGLARQHDVVAGE